MDEKEAEASTTDHEVKVNGNVNTGETSKEEEAKTKHPDAGDNVATIDHDEVHIDITRKPTETSEDPRRVEGATIITEQPGYDQPAVGYTSDSTVVINDMGTPVVKQGPLKPKPKDFVMTSCFVILCCNFIFGLFGYHFGVKSNHAWQLGDEVAARNRARTALIFVILGIGAGIVTYILAFTLYFTRTDHDKPL